MSLDEREQEEEIIMIEPETCCSHEPAPDTSRKNVDERKLLKKAIKKAFKAQKLLNQAIERLEAGQKQKRKHKQHKRRANSSSSSSSSSSSGTSSSSSSSSSSEGDVVDLTELVLEPPKRRHGRKHHHGCRHRHGRDRSRSRGHSRGRSRGRSRDHSRGHSRGRSRGHSRGHSRGDSHGRSRDHQLCQFTRFFRGASLPTAPPIQQCHHHHHRRSHTRPETTYSAHLDRRPRSRSGSRSHSRKRHGKRGHKKHHKNKKHKKMEKREETQHGGKDEHSKRGRSHSRDRSHSRGCRHGMPGFVYNEGLMGRPTRGYPYFGAFSDRQYPLPPPPPPPPYVQQSRDGRHSHRDQHRYGYPHVPVDAFNWQWMPPIYYGEERGRRHRAHSVPGC